MNSKRFATFVLINVILILGFVVSAFGQSQPESTEPTVQEAAVHRMADGSEVEGSAARLIRYDNGVTAAISTNDLDEGSVYTLWWVVFNAPENCSGGVCNADDIFIFENGVIPRDEAGNRVMNMEGILAAEISIQHAAGGYAVDGTLNTSASLGTGLVPGIVAGPGLTDPQANEIHLVVRTHGPKVDGAFIDQISSFGGGCDPIDSLPCDDVQYAVFTPVTE